MKKIIIVFLFLLSFLTANAATYYIATTGSNSNSGTSTSPWLTLQYACSRAVSGDIIHVNAGTYTLASQVNLPLGVSIEGEGTGSLFNCTVTASDTYGYAGYAIVLNSYPLANGNQHISGIKMDGNNLTGWGAIGIWYRNNVTISNCTFINFMKWGVRFYGGEPPAATSYMKGSVFNNNIITNCAGYYNNNSTGGLGIGGLDGMLIYGNTITQYRGGANDGDPINGVEGYIKNVKIYDNVISKTTVVGVSSWDFAIEIWNWENGNEIYNNNITGSIDVQEAVTHGYPYSVWIHDNSIGQPNLQAKQSIRGILLEIWNNGVIIERNYIHHVAQGVFARSLAHVNVAPYNNDGNAAGISTNITIRYNVFDQIGAATGALSPTGWAFYNSQEAGGCGFVNFKFYNNTCIASTSGVATSWGISLPDCGTSNNVLIENNIVYRFGGAPVRGNQWGNPTTISNVNIKNNIFSNNGNSNAVYIASGVVMNTYTNSGNLTTVPPFVSGTDYHLTDVRTGVFVESSLLDKDKVAVANPPTIGAYEFGTPPPAPILVTGITIGGSATITTNKGTDQLTATVLPTNASNKNVTWTIANGTGSATINTSGLVTAVSNGTVTVTAKATDGSNVSGTFVVTISNQVTLATSIAVNGTGGANFISTKSGTLQLIASVLPSTSSQVVTWTITNGTGSATISTTGLVTALTDGTVIAKATTTDGTNLSASLTITISNQIVYVTSIIVSGTNGATTISVKDGTLQMVATVSPGAANQSVTWSVTAGTGTASITPTGMLTALTDGTVTVRALAQDGSGINGTLIVTISNQIVPVVLVTNITIFGGTTISVDNGTLQLGVTVLPANAANNTVTWSVIPGTGNASISTTGLLTAIDNGTVTVKAVANDGSGISNTLVVTISGQIYFVTSITISGANSISIKGGTAQYTASVLPTNATNKTVTWSVTNGSGTATMSSTGMLTAVSDGSVIVKAIANDGSATFATLTVTISNQKVLVTTVNVSSNSSTITTQRGTMQMVATVFPTDATDKTVSWMVINGTGTGSISADGLLTALTNGSITVRATANDGSGIYGSKQITISNQTSTNRVTIYPNPTKGIITITINDPTLIVNKIRINNASGSLVYQADFNTTSEVINLPRNLKRGTYVVVLLNNTTIQYTQTIILSR